MGKSPQRGLIWLLRYGSATGPSDPRDLNNDGRIDSADLQILMSLCTNQGCKTPGDTNINIDIKPGSSTSPINLKSQGKIPVAILSTKFFDAPTNVDTKSLTFGHTGDEKSLAFCDSTPQDVNGDGLPDLVCHFTTQQTGFQIGDTVGVLKGATTSLIPIEGKDVVTIVP